MAGEAVPYGGQQGGADDPRQLRISDAERHQVAEILRQAAGEGRLDLEELEQRLEQTYAARTYADLVPITLDLPAHPHPRPLGRPPAAPPPPALPAPPPPRPGVRPAAAPPQVVPGPDRESHLAVLSGLSRKGVWVVPRHLSILCMMGGAELEL